jgi:hypothetical protein
MKDYHYKTGTYKSYNIFDSFRHGQNTGEFTSFKMPPLDQFDFSTLDVEEIIRKSPTYWIKQKLAYLHETQPLRLHYSGGNDSHTLLALASEMGIKFDQIFMYLTSPDQDIDDDWEFKPGVEYLKANPETYNDLLIEQLTIEDYEIWFDENTPYKYDAFYHGFRPTWSNIFMRNIHDDMLNVLGTEVPQFYFKNGISYLVLTNQYFYVPNTNHTDFFLDTIFPETTISQVYSSLNYIKQNIPVDYNGWIGFRSLDHDKQVTHNKAIGRVAPPEEFLKVTKTGNTWANYGFLNLKHQTILQKVISMGRLDIINAWFDTSYKLVEQFRNNSNVEIRTVSLSNINGITQDSIPIVLPVDRIGAIFRCDSNSMTKLDHTDISLL